MCVAQSWREAAPFVWPTCRRELISWNPVTHQASAVGERRHWFASTTSAIRLQVILGRKNALPNSINAGCNPANTPQAALRRKKKVRSLFLSELCGRSADVWVGKKLQRESWPPLTWSQSALECMIIIIIIYAVSSVKALLSILKMNEKSIASGQWMAWRLNISFSLVSLHPSWITVSWYCSHPGNWQSASNNSKSPAYFCVCSLYSSLGVVGVIKSNKLAENKSKPQISATPRQPSCAGSTIWNQSLCRDLWLQCSPNSHGSYSSISQSWPI